MKKIGLFGTIVSIIVLVATSVAWGFYDEIAKTLFDPAPLLCVLTILSASFTFIGLLMYLGLFDDF